MWSLKDDEYQTSYNDDPVDEHGVHQEEAPEEEDEGGEEQQEEEEEDTAESSQVSILEHTLINCVHSE